MNLKFMRKMCSFKGRETSNFILVALYRKYVYFISHSSSRQKIKAGKKNFNVKLKIHKLTKKMENYAKDEQNCANYNAPSLCTLFKATTIQDCHVFLT